MTFIRYENNPDSYRDKPLTKKKSWTGQMYGGGFDCASDFLYGQNLGGFPVPYLGDFLFFTFYFFVWILLLSFAL